jgi:hypothetical protein
MANKSTKFALRFRAHSFLILASLLALAISMFWPIGQALADPPATTTPSTTTTAPSTPSGAVNSVTPNNTPAHITETPIADNPDESQTCEQAAGPLSFFLCPLYSMVMKGINWLAGPNDSLLTQMLHVPPLQFTKDTGLARAYGNILAFVNGLFVLVFLVIIILSLVKDFSFLENYHLKQTLPRLVAAIIIAQFGYLLCGILIDIGNILGTLIPNTIAAGVLGSGAKLPGLADSVVGLLAFGNAKAVGAGTAAVTNVIFGGGTGLVFILLFLMAIAVLFSLLLAFIYMIARNLIIILLVLAAPLAFLAWVLPGTQNFFYRWGKNLLRLIFMYPLVVTVVTTAEILAFLLQHPTLDPNTFTDDRLKLLIGGLIPFIALLMIPKLLKLSGDMVELTGGAIAGFVAGKVATKGMEGAKAGHTGARDRLAQSEFGQTNRFGRFAAGGGVMALASPNSPKAVRRLGEARKRANAEYENAAKLGTDDELKTMLKNKNAVARQNALIGLGKRGMRETIFEGLQNGDIRPIDLAAVNKLDFDALKAMPDVRAWDFDAPGGGVKASFFNDINASIWGDAGGGTQKDWIMNQTYDPVKKKYEYSGYNTAKIDRFSPTQLDAILQDKSVRSKMNEDVRKALYNYATSNPHGKNASAVFANIDSASGTWK